MKQILIKSAMALGLLWTTTNTVKAQQKSIHPSSAVKVIFEGTTKAISSLPQLDEKTSTATQKAPENEFVRKGMKYYDNDPLPNGKDQALQSSYLSSNKIAGTSVQVLSNWEGIVPGADPSDNTLAVGPSHVVQMVNGSGTPMRIYNKSTGAVILNTKVSTIAGTGNAGDPNIIYDYQADRYILLVIKSINGGDLTVCVSKTNDPAGQYYVYTVLTGGSFSSDFPDYPKLSVWGDSYFVTTNASGPFVYALDRANMLNGATARTAQRFKLSDFPGGGVQACSPVFATGPTAPPANSKPIIMRLFDAAWTSSTSDVDALELYTMDINWVDSALSTMTGPLKLNASAFDSKICNDFNSGSCIPQDNSNVKLDAIGSIIYDKVQYGNFGTYEAIVCNYMVDGNNNNVAGMRWYELRRTTGDWSIFQQGTYAPNDNTHRWMGSISINSVGSIAMGYNVSGTTLFPGIRVTARRKNDAAGTMTASETIVQAGIKPKTASNRYGDYNGMLADPTDGSFWFTSNYNPTNSLKTNIVHFKIKKSSSASSVNATPEQIEINNVEQTFQVSPNPAKDKIILKWNASIAGNMPVQIMDLQGRVFLEKSVPVSIGNNIQTVLLGQIKSGTYFIRCHTEQGAFTQQLIIE